MSNIFISYAREDRARAKVLAGALEDQGWSVWWDRDVLPGERFAEIIKNELDKAKCIIVLWSKLSVESGWVQDEAAEGNRRRILVPAKIDDVEIPLGFRSIQTASLIDWKGEPSHIEFDRLLKAVSEIVGQPSLSKQSEPIPDKQPDSEVPSRGPVDHPKPAGLESKKAPSMSQKTKVLAAICVVTLITIVSIGVFFKGRQPEAGSVVTNSIGMKLVYIPAGSFTMGSSNLVPQLAREHKETEAVFENDLPQHPVQISEGFWMGQTEVTQGHYKSVVNAQPWSGYDHVQDDANNSAVYVNWYDAAEFCRKLSQQTGETYRLPTEAEWEYASRAGTTTRFSFGDSDSSLGDYAWFVGNTYEVGQEYAHPAGQKKPNPWGLYAMHGNVKEWCSDYYDKDYYSNSPSVDPNGPPSGDFRSLRGGGWDNDGDALGSSDRFFSNPLHRDYDIGFRVVRSQP